MSERGDWRAQSGSSQPATSRARESYQQPQSLAMRTAQTTSSDRTRKGSDARAAQLCAGSPGRACRPWPFQVGHPVRREPPARRSPVAADACIVNDDPSHVYLKRAHRQLDVLSHCRRALSTVPTSVHSYSDLCKPLPASHFRWSRLAIQQQQLTQTEPLLRVARRGEKRFTRPSSPGTNHRGAPPPLSLAGLMLFFRASL